VNLFFDTMEHRKLVKQKVFSILEALGRELKRESHNLLERPQLLWQQVHNRLQWVPSGRLDEHLKAKLDSELSHRISSGDYRWLKLLTPARESRALLRTLKGHENYVSACAFSPDGKILISSSWDKTLRVWECSSGREIATLTDHADQVGFCAASPDGHFFASSSYDKTVRLWRFDTFQCVKTFEGHNKRVTCCAFSPDGGLLASCDDFTVKLWDVKKGRELETLRPGNIKHLSFSPDGKQILLVRDGGRFELWNSTLKRREKTFSDYASTFETCSFSPDGQFITSGTGGGKLSVWETGIKREVATLKGHQEVVNSCAFSPDGEYLISASGNPDLGWESALIVWKTGTWHRVTSLQGHTEAVKFCAFSPNGDTFVSASADNTLKIWLTEEAIRLEDTEEKIVDYIYDARFSPDGRMLVCGCRDKLLKLRDGVSGKEIWSLEGHKGSVLGCAFSPQGDYILCIHSGGSIKLWNTEKREEERTLAIESSPEFVHFHSLTFSPNGERVAAVMRYVDGHVLVMWDTKTGEERVQAELNDEAESFYPSFPCSFSPDGRLFVSRSYSELTLNDANTGEEIMSMGEFTEAYAFSPDGKYIAYGDRKKQIAVFVVSDLLEGDYEEMFLKGHEAVVSSCSFSPDGKLIVSGDENGVLKMWDIRSRREIWSIKSHSRSVIDCRFSPTGKLLLSAGYDRAVKLWHVTEPVETGAFFCLGDIRHIEFSTSNRHLVCTDDGGNLYLLELVGFEKKK
jgi:WD40 repeat protein